MSPVTTHKVLRRVQSLGELLAAKNLRVAVAESCTGGGLGALLSAVPGSSRWFVGGVISYSDQVKLRLLDVPQDIIDDEGAVSEACAQAMARGGRTATGADCCVSITGIAGPGGGSEQKPVGTVCFALADAKNCTHSTQRFGPLGRQQVRDASVEFALQLLESFAAQSDSAHTGAHGT